MSDFKTRTNVFVLTTEYHFLLAVNVIDQQYPPSHFRNLFVFTGERLSMVKIENLPPHIRVVELPIDKERNFKKVVDEKIFSVSPANLFVFTAYRDLETYLLCSVDRSVTRHLVQDGANFYFNITTSVTWSRLKETVKIYRKLWQKGIILKRLVRYKKHMADCHFIDQVWVTNPEVYVAPPSSRKLIAKIDLQRLEENQALLAHYFSMQADVLNNCILYLSSRLIHEKDIAREITQVHSVLAALSKPIFIKLHPNAPDLQERMFSDAFPDRVTRNFIPAELYIAKAKNCLVIGVASAALYYYNPMCRYVSIIRIFQAIGMYPLGVDSNFPSHVHVVRTLDELSSIAGTN
jgi:hypothetical protein